MTAVQKQNHTLTRLVRHSPLSTRQIQEQLFLSPASKHILLSCALYLSTSDKQRFVRVSFHIYVVLRTDQAVPRR